MFTKDIISSAAHVAEREPKHPSRYSRSGRRNADRLLPNIERHNELMKQIASARETKKEDDLGLSDLERTCKTDFDLLRENFKFLEDEELVRPGDDDDDAEEEEESSEEEEDDEEVAAKHRRVQKRAERRRKREEQREFEQAVAAAVVAAAAENETATRTQAPDGSKAGERLAAAYYRRLFREYVLVDLSRYREKKVGMRWRTESEVIEGKGQYTCANLRCDREHDLQTYEVLFRYLEHGLEKEALVKARLCPKCLRKVQAAKAYPPRKRAHSGNHSRRHLHFSDRHGGRYLSSSSRHRRRREYDYDSSSSGLSDGGSDSSYSFCSSCAESKEVSDCSAGGLSDSDAPYYQRDAFSPRRFRSSSRADRSSRYRNGSHSHEAKKRRVASGPLEGSRSRHRSESSRRRHSGRRGSF